MHISLLGEAGRGSLVFQAAGLDGLGLLRLLSGSGRLLRSSGLGGRSLSRRLGSGSRGLLGGLGLNRGGLDRGGGLLGLRLSDGLGGGRDGLRDLSGLLLVGHCEGFRW